MPIAILDRPADPAEASLLREAFQRRATEAIAHATRVATPAALAEALSAPTDAGALVRLLSATVGQDAIATLDPFAEAIARGAEIKQQLIKEAGGGSDGSEWDGRGGIGDRAAIHGRLRTMGDPGFPDHTG